MSSACCDLPPVQAEYTPKGAYTEIGGFKSYVVGPEDAKSVIVMIYDVFGFAPQFLQGCDMLASLGFRIVIPDILLGDYATKEMFSGSEEGNKRKAEWWSKFPGSIPTQSAPVAKVINEIRSASTGVKIGIVGACWGYKVAVTSEGSKAVDAIAGIHPTSPAVEDADNLTVPLCLLASKDENMETLTKVFEAMEAKLAGKNILKQYPNVHHGWMAARADLSGGEATDNFVDGYQTLAKFFKDTL